MTVLSFSDLHWLAVVVAAVIFMVIGSWWYSPMGFGKMWAKALGKKTGDMGDANMGYGVTTVGALVQSFVLANLVRDIGLTTASDGLMLGFAVWLGFFLFVMAGDTIFSGRSMAIGKINSGYYLVVLLINGALLAAWH